MICVLLTDNIYFYFLVLGTFFRQDADWACQGCFFQSASLRAVVAIIPIFTGGPIACLLRFFVLVSYEASVIGKSRPSWSGHLCIDLPLTGTALPDHLLRACGQLAG